MKNEDFFVTPKEPKKSVRWRVTLATQRLVSAYALSVGYTEDDLVEEVLKRLADDPAFQEWVKNKRNNKRVTKLLEGNRSDGQTEAVSTKK